MRCKLCNIKINASQEVFCKCKCENTFCKNHRFAYIGNNSSQKNGHICSYDYKQNDALNTALLKIEPIIADKLLKI